MGALFNFNVVSAKLYIQYIIYNILYTECKCLCTATPFIDLLHDDEIGDIHVYILLWSIYSWGVQGLSPVFIYSYNDKLFSCRSVT